MTTDLVLDLMAQRSKVVNFSLKGPDACQVLIVLLLKLSHVSLMQLKHGLHFKFIYIHLLALSFLLNERIADVKSFLLVHLDLLSKADTLLLLTLEFLFEGLIDDCHEVVRAEGLSLYVTSEAEEGDQFFVELPLFLVEVV